MNEDRLAIGWVDYWNLLPMRLELQRLWGRELRLVCGTPRQINRCLLAHEVAVAPASSVCLLNNLQLNMALPLGVACDGQVRSVYLGFGAGQQELKQAIVARTAVLAHFCRETVAVYGHDLRGMARAIRTQAASTRFARTDFLPLSSSRFTRTDFLPLSSSRFTRTDFLPLSSSRLAEPLPLFKLSPHSATSNALLHVFYQLWFGEESYRYFAEHVPYEHDAQVQLLIGDEALRAAEKFPDTLDLGKIWKDMTGLPFVFAVWQAHTPLSETWRHRLLDAAELATARMRVEPSDYLTQVENCGAVNLADYWQHIYYTLRGRELKSLYLFLNLYRLLTAQHEADEAISTRLVRWEEQASHAH